MNHTIYFDHQGDCREGDHHKTCAGRRRGVVSLGFDVDRKRIRSKVTGQINAEVKDKLKALHLELDAEPDRIPASAHHRVVPAAEQTKHRSFIAASFGQV